MYPYLSPRGINSRTFDGRPGCPFCGYCQGFGCAVNDRASSANTVLKKAIDTGRCEVKTGCNVTRLIHQNGKIEGVEYCSNGSDAPESSDELVVVANGQDREPSVEEAGTPEAISEDAASLPESITGGMLAEKG